MGSCQSSEKKERTKIRANGAYYQYQNEEKSFKMEFGVIQKEKTKVSKSGEIIVFQSVISYFYLFSTALLIAAVKKKYLLPLSSHPFLLKPKIYHLFLGSGSGQQKIGGLDMNDLFKEDK